MVIWVILFAVSSVRTDPMSYEGYSVMKSLPKTVQGQDFLDNEIKSQGEECNVWKAPQKQISQILCKTQLCFCGQIFAKKKVHIIRNPYKAVITSMPSCFNIQQRFLSPRKLMNCNIAFDSTLGSLRYIPCIGRTAINSRILNRISRKSKVTFLAK